MKTANLVKNINNFVPKTTINDDYISTIPTTFKDIPFDNIVIEDNIRSSYNDESISELASSIKEYGLLNPLTVYADGNVYKIVAGHRRYLAIKTLGITSVPCKIIDDSTLVKELQLIENIQREELSDNDLYNGLLFLYDKYNNYDQIAEILGKSKSWVSKRMKVADTFISSDDHDAPADVVGSDTYDDVVIDMDVSTKVESVSHSDSSDVYPSHVEDTAIDTTVSFNNTDHSEKKPVSKKNFTNAYNAVKKNRKPQPKAIDDTDTDNVVKAIDVDHSNFNDYHNLFQYNYHNSTLFIKIDNYIDDVDSLLEYLSKYFNNKDIF